MVSFTGVDFGGIKYINKKPRRDRERFLWEHRAKHGQCPHCGQFVFKRIGVVRYSYTPLSIPGKVDEGVCVRLDCKPRARFASTPPNEQEVDSDDETIAITYDSIMSVVEGIRLQMTDMAKKVENKERAQDKKEAAELLTDTILQLTRTMQEATHRDKIQLQSVKTDLIKELQLARRALSGLSSRMDQAERGLDVLNSQLNNLRGYVHQNCKETGNLKAEVEAMRTEMATMHTEMAAMVKWTSSLAAAVRHTKQECVQKELKRPTLY